MQMLKRTKRADNPGLNPSWLVALLREHMLQVAPFAVYATPKSMGEDIKRSLRHTHRNRSHRRYPLLELDYRVNRAAIGLSRQVAPEEKVTDRQVR